MAGLTSLSSGKPAEDAYNGFMFSVRATHDPVRLHALRVATKCGAGGALHSRTCQSEYCEKAY